MADIELRGIRKTYGTTVPTHALRGINLDVKAGEYLAVIGRSGSELSPFPPLAVMLPPPIT